jgi:hypothetical protein
MSTKTTFKRIALVAVAALGLGVLSVAPSSAVVSNLTVTVADGTSSYTKSDSTTAATVNITGLLEVADSVTVNVVTKSVPSGSVPAVRIHNLDSATSTIGNYKVETITAGLHGLAGASAPDFDVLVSTVGTDVIRFAKASAAANINHTLGLQLDSATARVAGTYTYTVVVKAWNAGSAAGNTDNPDTTITKDVSIVVAAAATSATTPSALTSFANLISTAQAAGTAKASDDAVISVVATAGTAGGYLFVGNRNAADGSATALDSLTATVTGVGVVCATTGFASPTVGTCGKSIKVAATGDYQFALQADGTAGTSSITVSASILGASYTKSVNYYAKAAKTLTASVLTPVLTVGANDSAVAVTAVDANGTNWSGAAYIVASSATDALVGGSDTTPVACVYNSVKQVHYCPVTTISTGTAKFKVIDAATVALATATSNEVSVTASNQVAATVKVAFDKASYAPGEKAIITVTPLSSTGAKLAASTGNYLAAALTSNVALTASGAATTSFGAASVTTVAYDGTDSTAGSYSIVVYMPQASGTVTLTGKGGTSLPLAGQVAVTASADVVNASVDAATDAANEATDAANAATDAALAAADAADAATAAAQDASDAVAALSATVAKLVASLKAQITSLTNLVIKIQKKVRA